MATILTSPSVPPNQTMQLLYVLKNADMQSTSDQTFTKTFSGTNWLATHTIGNRITGGASVACAGGIYDGAGKTGNTILSAASSWVTLASGVIVTFTSLLGTALLSATPILSLTTGSTAACTADIEIWGLCLDRH